MCKQNIINMHNYTGGGGYKIICTTSNWITKYCEQVPAKSGPPAPEDVLVLQGNLEETFSVWKKPGDGPTTDRLQP